MGIHWQASMYAVEEWARSWAPTEELEESMVLLLACTMFLAVTTLGKVAMMVLRAEAKVD